MRKDNPANYECENKERSPDGTHNWLRRADGTATCEHCGMHLNAADTRDAFPPIPPRYPKEPPAKKPTPDAA